MRVTSLRWTAHARPRPHVVVRAFDAHGRCGTGEAAPLAPFSPDTVADCERAFAACADCLTEIDDDLAPAEAVARALARAPLPGAPSARFALETALFDLVGLERQLSVARCLGGARPEDASVAMNGLLLPEPSETLADRACQLATAYVALKIKLRARDEGEFERELTALREVRARLPLPYELRLDANGAWSLDVARRRLEALADVAPRYVEQPVAAELLHRLGECAVPWAADESLALPELVDPILASRGCAAIVVKPAIVGGLLRARQLALRAADHGKDVVVTHLCDGPYAMAAACELALSLPRPPLACGLAPHGDLAAFLHEHGEPELPQLAHAGKVRSSGGPGLRVRARGGA